MNKKKIDDDNYKSSKTKFNFYTRFIHELLSSVISEFSRKQNIKMLSNYAHKNESCGTPNNFLQLLLFLSI